MGWTSATVEMEAGGCPAPERLEPGQELECLRPGATGPATGLFSQAPRDGWEVMVDTDDGYYARSTGRECDACPLSCLPRDVMALRATVANGRIRANLVAPSKEDLSAVVKGYAEDGSLRAIRWGHKDAPQRRRLVDLDALTPRQWDALRAAIDLDYFVEGSGSGVDEVAQALGIGRSAAHRHLRKGMERLLLELL